MLSSLRASAEVFEPTPTAKLPLPVRMWLQPSIRAGTPLARTAWLRMRGHIRIRAWRPFVATQVLAPGVGFIWAATAKVAGTPVLGYDKYVDGVGEMRWGIGGLVPVMSARDTNISISAAGRLAAESVFVPTAFAGPAWSSDDTGAHAMWSIDTIGRPWTSTSMTMAGWPKVSSSAPPSPTPSFANYFDLAALPSHSTCTAAAAARVSGRRTSSESQHDSVRFGISPAVGTWSRRTASRPEGKAVWRGAIDRKRPRHALAR